MTRDELEAAIRRELAGAVNAAANPTAVNATHLWNRAVDAILEAAEKYAVTEYGITADRRAELAAAVTKPRALRTHLAKPGDVLRPACGFWMVNPAVTASRGHVDCGACKNTRAWKETP